MTKHRGISRNTGAGRPGPARNYDRAALANLAKLSGDEPLALGSAAIWQPPYNDSEPVTILRPAVEYASGKRSYYVQCRDGERVAQGEDLRPA